MAALSSYRMVAFNQGNLALTHGLQFNKEAKHGMCAGLCMAWVLDTNRTHQPYVLDGLVANAQSIFVKQMIFKDAMTVTPDSALDGLNAISHITRLKLDQRAAGAFVDPLVTVMGTASVGYYLLGLFGTKLGHMMALFRGPSHVDVFDQNFGVFSATLGDAADDLAVQLWAEYKAMGCPIENWLLYGLAGAHSARDRMIAALAKL